MSTIRDTIETSPDLSRLLPVVESRLDDDPGHDLSHALRVAHWTVQLNPNGDHRCSIAAALLHDVVNLPKNSPDRHLASERSAEVARELLPSNGFSSDETSAIADAIRDHSFSRGAIPETDLGRALQDADRLEALGALGVFRTISCGTQMDARYFEPSDPWAKDRELNDIQFSVDHFFRKLLKLPATMLTELGKVEATRRAKFMADFLRQLGHELGEAPSEESLQVGKA